MATPGPYSVWTSKKRDPSGHYVVALGVYAKEVLKLDEAERVGSFYIYRTKSWREVQKIVERAKALRLEVRE